MELYEFACPELMRGKKILYVHGFASSGQGGTVKTMRLLLPEAEIIAPDLPVSPLESLSLLKKICANDQPDLIIGTSMGGMFTQQLRGFDRIAVNPAFHLADTILKNNGLGRQEFHSPRKDGQSSFMVTKGLLEEFREASSGCFAPDDEPWRIYGLFGIRDSLVDCFDEFASHYPLAIHFDGEHYLDDHTFLRSVMPLIRRIDDRQEGREKKIIAISMEDTLLDTRNGDALGIAVKAFDKLCENYDCQIIASFDHNHPEAFARKLQWADSHIGVPAWGKVIALNAKELLLADYLIDRSEDNDGFMGTVILFGSEQFHGWEEILDYFSRLGGQ